MTRQETISHIGECTASTFNNAVKNQMSYFIIPIPHKMYDIIDKTRTFDSFGELGWKFANSSEIECEADEEDKRVFTNNDPTNIGSIKTYIYEHMLPKFSYDKTNKERDFTRFVNEYNNMLFQKMDLEKDWKIDVTTRSMT